MLFRHTSDGMELRHLRYFTRVAQELNFTKAALALRVAQPALSRQVQDLENEIGVALLVRGPRGVSLTAEGKLFAAEAQMILAQAEGAVEKVRALARGEYGTLSVGYAPSPTLEILPPALAAFRAAYPRVTVNLQDLAGDEIVSGLRSGSLDLGLMVRPLEENVAGLDFEPLLRVPLVLACSPNHPLSKLKRVKIEQLFDHELIVFRRDGYSDYHHLLHAIFTGRSAPRIAVECDSMSSLITELAGGRGVAILAQFAAKVVGARLAIRPLQGCDIVQEVGLCRALKGDVTSAGEKFCDSIRIAAKKVKV
jgi:LysR family transcriptional regulator, benzoate and cis,cis-muconate-responsive activator of ben and cat genes